MSSEPALTRPKPQHMWTTSPPPSEPTSPAAESADGSEQLSPVWNSRTINNAFSAPRTRSILNLTGSTLAGIYAPDDDSSLFGITPLHTGGATTPSNYPPTPKIPVSVSEEDRERDRMAPVIGALEQPQFRARPTALGSAASTPTYVRVFRGVVRASLLFALGAAYGSLVTHLHDTRNLAPIKLEGVRRESYGYTIFWGLAGILLGTALPIVDAIWEGEMPEDKRQRIVRELGARNLSGNAKTGSQGDSPFTEAVGLGAAWNPVVRSIGAFVGIAFAIRRLPWQSTLQASVTLGLANPCLWYMIDRTFPGFALSSAVGIVGTSVLLGTNVVPMPDVKNVIPSNGSHLRHDSLPLGIEQGALAVWIWIASVLFCSCVCFGNIGRRLALATNPQ